jgi:hypothetical protein
MMISSSLMAQWSWQVHGGMSTFRPHRSEMHLSQNGFAHADISAILYTSGNRRWSADNGAPRVGLRYAFYQFPDRAMGQAHGLNAFLSKDFVRRDNWRWYWQAGFGLGYLTRVFDPVDNPRQNAISSRLNVYVDARMGVALTTRERWETHLGIMAYHFSNAANKLPNSGMNFLGAYLGWSPKVTPKASALGPKKPDKKNEWLIGFNGWARQSSEGKPYDLIGNGYVEYNRRITPRYQIGAGVNLFYEAYEKVYERWATFWGDGGHPTYDPMNLLASGVHINNEWMTDRFSAFFHFGLYTHGHQREMNAFADYGEGPYEHQTVFIRSEIFHRIGFRYRLTNHLSLNLSMLTHFFKAQYTEMGVAVRL